MHHALCIFVAKDSMEASLRSLAQLPYVDIILRALAVYVFIIIALRIFGKKELAQLSVTDLVFILLISNAVQNAMVGPDTSLSGGIAAAAALFAANYTLKKLLYRSATFSKIVQGEPVLLIYNGKIQASNCAASGISLPELDAAVREHGVDTPDDVDLAMLEVDGNISIVSRDYKKRTTHTIARRHKLKGKILKR